MSTERAKYNTRPTANADSDLSGYVFGKVQPQAIPLEEAVIGALLIDRNALLSVVNILTPECFYLEAHQHIYRAILALFSEAAPVDILTVTEHMHKAATLDKIGGAYYLVELTHRVASAANVEYHARIVAQKHIRRQLIEAASETIREAYEDVTDDFDLLERTEGKIFRIGHAKSKSGATPLKDLTLPALMDAEKAMLAVRKGAEFVGIQSGLRALDNETGGFRAPWMVIIAGRPAMGKTSLALKIAMGAAKTGKAVGLFSLEMSKGEITNRMMCMDARVNGQEVANGQLADVDWRRLASAKEKIDPLPIYIDDTPGLSIMQMRALARRMKMKHDVQMIVVDYLQLMSHSGENKGNRERQVAEISGGLKNLAKEIGVPVIALAQLSRAVEVRGGSKRPGLSDLRESGAIENDADMVIFTYRPEYYGILEDEDGNSLKGVAELIIAKHRHGRTSTPTVRFESEFALFSDIEKPSSQFPASEIPAYNPAAGINPNRNEDYIPF